MAKIAVCIDDWKLDIFKEELNDAGFSFTKYPGVTSDTLTLSVHTVRVEELTRVIRNAQERAAIYKRDKH
jgi:hypothetical protein